MKSDAANTEKFRFTNAIGPIGLGQPYIFHTFTSQRTSCCFIIDIVANAFQSKPTLQDHRKNLKKLLMHKAKAVLKICGT